MSRDAGLLLDMHKAATLAVEFRGELDKVGFLRDRKTQSSVIDQLLILGECSKRISEKFRLAHPEIPWRGIAGMRDKLIHDYTDVDLDEVWRTLTEDVPELIRLLTPLVPLGAA